MSRRGFTLTELLLTLMIAALVLGLGVINLFRARTGAGARGLAELVAEEFRSARQAAVARQHPVAVVLPSGQGTVPCCDGLYWLEGDTARQTRQFRFGNEVKGAVLFAGSWPVDPSGFRDPGQTPSGAPLTFPGQATLDLAAWLPASARQDYCFVYLPDGSLLTNDLVHYDGEYHLLACVGAAFSAAPTPPGAPTLVPGPNYFQPSRLGQPWTIALSSMGGVRTRKGVLGVATGAVADVDGLACVPGPASPPPSATANEPPVLTAQPRLSPRPNPFSLPAGVDVTLPKESYVTVELSATDPDGDPLFCNWSATGGGYASTGELPMTFDAPSGEWKALWHWRPPPTCSAPDRFELTYQVRDAQGAVANPVWAQVADVQILDSGKILYASDAGGDIEVWTMNIDGSGQRALTDNNFNDWTPMSAGDGTFMVTWSFVNGNANPSKLVRMYADGSGYRRLTNFWGWELFGIVNPAGDRVAYTNGWNLWVIDPDGSNRVNVCNTNVAGYNAGMVMGWSGDGQWIFYPKLNGAVPQVWKVKVADPTGPGNNVMVVPATSTAMIGGVGSSDPADDSVYYLVDQGGGMNDLYRSGSAGVQQLTNTPVDEGFARVSPDGRYAVFYSNGDLYRTDVDGSNPLRLTNTPAFERDPCWAP